MPSFKVAGAAFALLSLVPSVLCDCESFGVDFQSGGTYFQNSKSNESFTALQEFTGCQDDSAHNVIVNPKGDQSECSETAMTPDDTPGMITCSEYPKNKLSTGDWSLLIISNNGNGDPIAYQRDFSLTVGEQSTVMVTPTVTVSVVETPVYNVSTTTTSTVTEQADASTVIDDNPGVAIVTPRPTTKTVTKGVVTLTQQSQTYEIKSSTQTVPASCSVKATRRQRDPLATILPSVLGQLDQIAADVMNLNKELVGDISGLIGLNRILGVDNDKRDLTASAKFRREILEGRSPSEDLKREFVLERRNMLEARNVEKRAPDSKTVTSTDNANIYTSTVSSVAPTTTQTVTQTILVTVTTTPPPVTAGRSTVTVSGVTTTKTVVIPIVNITKTQTLTTTIVNTVTTTSSGAAQACASKGGQLV